MSLRNYQTRIVTPFAEPPLISIAFGAASIPLNDTTTLVFTITNPNLEAGLTDITWVDNLPAGIVVGPVPGVIDTCLGGTVVAVAGSSQISYSGGSLAAQQSCTITVTVKGTIVGVHNDQVESISARESGQGVQSNVATLEVTPPVAVGPAALILNSLSVIDLTNTAAPVVAGSTVAVPNGGAGGVSGSTEAIDTTNHVFYVLSGVGGVGADQLQSVDVTDRTTPTILDSIPCTKGDANYRTVLSSDKNLLACVNTGDGITSTAPNDIQMFDVSDPTNMSAFPSVNILTGFALPQSNADTAVMNGRILHVISNNVSGGGSPGLIQLGIYDLTNPLAVTQLSVTTIRNTGDIDTVAVLNDVITVAGSLYAVMWIRENGAGDQRIECWNVTVPGTPTLAGSSPLLPVAIQTNRWSQVASGHLFGASISAAQPNIIGVNVTNPAAPTVDGATAGADQRAGFSVRAAVVGGTRYVYVCQTLVSASTNRTLQIYDATVPGALVALGRVIYRVGGSNQQLHLDA